MGGKNLIKYMNKESIMKFKIILIVNKKTKEKVCEHYYQKFVNLDKSKFEVGLPLNIGYMDNSFFAHEIVQSVEPFEKHGLKIETTKKIWYIH